MDEAMSNDNTKVEYYRKLLDEALANSEPEPPFVHLPGCISAEQMMLSRTFGGERYCMWCEPCNMAWNAAIDAARAAVWACRILREDEPANAAMIPVAVALAAIDALREEQK